MQAAINGLVNVSLKLLLIFAIVLLSSNHQHHHNDVSCAPPSQQQPQPPQQSAELAPKSVVNYVGDGEKKADLTNLINETLSINNKSISSEGPAEEIHKANNNNHVVVGLKDDWTFDMVEYDLMEFLQDLSARYRLANNNNKSLSDSSPSSDVYANSDDGNLQGKSQVANRTTTTTSKQEDALKQQQQSSDPHPNPQQTKTITTTTSTTAVKINQTELSSSSLPEGDKLKAAKEHEKQSSATLPPPVVVVVTSEPPPISLASGDDHDIAESTWQYGIFDRFTRARGSQTTASTTPSPPLEPLNSGANHLDVRSFNSDECGLRTYEEESSYYPIIGGFEQDQQQLEQVVASKELNQRRQRPPPIGSSFLAGHKKYQPGGLSGLDVGVGVGGGAYEDDNSNGGGPSDSNDGDQLVRRPIMAPFDSYPSEQAASSSHHSNTHKHLPSGIDSSSSSSSSHDAGDQNDKQSDASSSSPSATNGGGGGGGLDGASASTGASGEFNLSFRRQWLQQQLGHTLQMLGFNTTNQSAAEFLNQTSGLSLNFRENMMKKSNLNSVSSHKAAKSLDSSEASKASALPQVIQDKQQQQPEITEQELKARQDELKLEARVIGGSDARLGDSPWSVSLQALVSRPGTGGVEYRHYCGGTIISEYYILTAAHCLDFMVGRESRLFVVVGDLNWRMSAASLHGRRFGIEKLIIHSGYKSTAFGHDIGLIRVKESMKPLKVNGRYIVNSVCLPEKGVEHSGEAELVGWGLFSNRNEMADSLQIADVPILPRPLCVDLYKRRTGLIQWLIGIELITEKQICAGTFGRGICQGDSGSALVYNEKFTRVQTRPDGKAALRKSSLSREHQQQQRATIIGIVAFGGIRRCSYQSLPGVYMQTSKYLDWILPRIK